VNQNLQTETKPWTEEEQARLTAWTAQANASWSGQNWTDEPITEQEKDAAEAAIRHVFWQLTRVGVVLPEVPECIARFNLAAFGGSNYS
jgi:hypothetical protein